MKKFNITNKQNNQLFPQTELFLNNLSKLKLIKIVKILLKTKINIMKKIILTIKSTKKTVKILTKLRLNKSQVITITKARFKKKNKLYKRMN